MNNKLALILTRKGLITGQTEVETFYQSPILGNVTNSLVKGDFTVCGYSIDENELVMFKVRSLRDGSYYEVPAVNVVTIDGMEPERYAQVYDINIDGTKVAQQKRRGRKPKKRLEDGTL